MVQDTRGAARPRLYAAGAIAAAWACLSLAARAQDAPAPDPAQGATEAATQATTPAATPADAVPFAFHAQATFIYQGHDAFASPFRGANSLNPSANARETADVTLYGGWRPLPGVELWIDPEVDQGFGLSDTLGLAGFSSGEAYKVGAAEPYVRLQRIFLRWTIDLPGAREDVDADQNQFAGSRGVDRIVLTGGKLSVGDIFDANRYAHDPRADFFNWTLIDAGTFDYAADSWGYSAGVAAEWWRGPWTLRGGAFLLSNVPNSPELDTRFKQFQMLAEVERRYKVGKRAGSLKATAFVSRARMADLDAAVAAGGAEGGPPDLLAARRYASRSGVDVNLQQEITADLGGFLRAGVADGSKETYEFTDVDRSVSAGLSLTGRRWGRADDTVGLAGVVNAASAERERYLAAGGLGILIGDGRLPHPSTERILEAYYQWAVVKAVHVALDYQHVDNPAYDTDRGPVSILAVRLHGQF